MQIGNIQLASTFMLFLVAFNKPTISLNTTVINSGKPLQINCSADELDDTASFLYEIQLDGVTVASENKSFVRTIQSVKSTEAGNYTCNVSLTAAPHIVRVSNGTILSGKNTFLIVDFSLLSSMEFFFVSSIDKFLITG